MVCQIWGAFRHLNRINLQKSNLKDTDTEGENLSKDDNLFFETIADDKDEVQQTKKLVKTKKSSKNNQKRSIFDFPEDADSDDKISMCSLIM